MCQTNVKLKLFIPLFLLQNSLADETTCSIAKWRPYCDECTNIQVPVHRLPDKRQKCNSQFTEQRCRLGVYFKLITYIWYVIYQLIVRTHLIVTTASVSLFKNRNVLNILITDFGSLMYNDAKLLQYFEWKWRKWFHSKTKRTIISDYKNYTLCISIFHSLIFFLHFKSVFASKYQRLWDPTFWFVVYDCTHVRTYTHTNTAVFFILIVSTEKNRQLSF